MVQQPPPRSACQFVAGDAGGTATLVGGYARVRVKGDIYRGVTYDDAWQLVSTPVDPAAPPAAKGSAGAQCTAAGLAWSWAKLRPAGTAPAQGSRCGASAAFRAPAQMVSFGGVQDQETEDSVQGRFNDCL